MNRYSTNSASKVCECEIDLQTILFEAIKYSPYDYGISEGHRETDRQFDLFKKGRSFLNGEWVVVDDLKVVTNVDGIRNKSYHNYTPSRAFDIFAWVDGKISYEPKHLLPIAGHILKTARKLRDEGKVSRHLDWGGFFKTITDMPHFQIDV